MIVLNPREMFQSNDDQVKEFNGLVHSPTLQIALALSMTQYMQSRPSAEEIKGVNEFIKTFLNFGQKNEPTPQATYKSISHSLPRHLQEQPKKYA